MKHRWASVPLKPVLVLGLAVTPWVVQAQVQEGSVHDWRKANETVGQYPRGHADVLRWEKTQMAPPAAAQSASPEFALPSAPDAIRAAWKVHRELASPLARLGQQNVERIAAGAWGELDPSLQRRIEGADEVLEVAASTRKAWISAVAARQTLKSVEDAVTAAEAAAELGRRMVSVGNWSRYQQAQVALGESSARMELKRARLAASQAERALLKSMGLDTVHSSVALPDRLPDAAATPMSDAELRARLAAIQGNLPAAQGRKAGNNAMQAYAVYAASLDIYRSYRNDVLKQRELIGEETQLRYNGMLESVWGLLADVGARSQAVVAAIGAQRDTLIAETDLQWVLQGGQPDAFVALGGGEQAAAAAGH
jgi:hypothetical protein